MSLNLLRDLNVLIVDDNPSDRLVLSMLLKSMKIRSIQEAEDGSVALFKIDNAKTINKPFHLIMLDWNMPRSSGIQLLQKLREDKGHQSLGIILMSGTINEERIEIASDYKVDDILVKPSNSEVARQKILRVINKIGWKTE